MALDTRHLPRQTFADSRGSIPAIIQTVRRHHFMPHGYALALWVGFISGLRANKELPRELKHSFWASFGAVLCLLAIESVLFGRLVSAWAGMELLGATLLWSALAVPALLSQISLVRPPGSKQVYTSFGVPNTLTLYRALSMPLVLIATVEVLGTPYEVGPGAKLLLLSVYCCVALSDMLDGLIARLTGRVTDFGRVFDPVVDIFVFITFTTAFWAAGMLPWPYLMLVLLRFLLPLLGGAFLFMFVGPFEVRPTLSGKAAVLALASYLAAILMCQVLPCAGLETPMAILMWVSASALALHVALTGRRGLMMLITHLRASAGGTSK